MKKLFITYGLVVGFFLVAKITGLVAWCWIWVLSPLWIPVVLLFILFLAIYIIYGNDIDSLDEYRE